MTVCHTITACNGFHLRFFLSKWKSLRWDLLEVDRMTALIHYERQRWKKVNVFAKKPLRRSLFQHVQTLCMPSFIDLHIHATPGHVTSFACSRNTSDRSLAWSHHRRRSTRDRSRSRWNMKHFRQTARGCLLHQYCHSASRSRMQLAQALFSNSWRSSTGHDWSQCTTTKDRSRKKAVMVALWSFLLDRLDVERSILRFPRPLHASEGALRILAKGNWKSKVFWWGSRLDGRCSAQAEQRKKPVAVVHLPGAYLSTETNLVPIRGVMKKEFDTGHTDTRN